MDIFKGDIMKNKSNIYKLTKKTIACALVIASLSGCGSPPQDIECNIEQGHIHLYTNYDKTLSRYIEGEKEYFGNLNRTEDYLPLTEELSSASKMNLYRIEDNIDYLEEIISSCHPQRQAYVYDYVYNYHYNFWKDKWGFGWHWDYEWQDISFDTYTENKVKDTTYQFRFYKLNKDGTKEEKLFNSLDEVEQEYKYFIPGTLVQKNISEPYFLPKENQKTKTN